MSDTFRVAGQHDPCLGLCHAADMDSPGERLRAAREKAGLSVEGLAERAGLAASSVRAHENGQNNIRPNRAQAYASALRISPAWLLYGDKLPQGEKLPIPETTRLPIRFEVAAGAWEPVEDWRDEPLGFGEAHRVTAYDGIEQWLERVVGDSYNMKIPDGSLIHVVDAIELQYKPRHGDSVVVVRRRAQGSFVERSVKEVVLTPFGVELWPRSYNPKWDQPLHYTNGAEGADDVEVQIVGVVLSATLRLTR